jgi:ATP-dependent DNA helicase RecQ
MVVTVTATKETKEKILDTLHLPADITVIEKSPNLFYTKQYLDKNDPLEEKFGSLINELKTIEIETQRAIIYCQTCKQCSVLFRLFEVCVGTKMFHGNTEPRNRVVDMYHAGTPTSVKNHISENMANDNGHIRVLISTIAFGMGVNCEQVRSVIHFGPSKTVESYIQECRRAGCD